MRKKSASGVLASLRGSTYGAEYWLIATLLDGLFAHPMGHFDADTAHALAAVYRAAIEFFRSLLGLTSFSEANNSFPGRRR